MSALLPAGPQAAHVAALWNVMLVVTGVVFVAIVAATIVAVARARRDAADAPSAATGTTAGERRSHRIIWAAVLASTVLLAGLVVASAVTDRALASLPTDGALRITLTAHQWWWEATYEDGGVHDRFTTANELHIPVGRPVLFTLAASDVIHSLWVPELAGKKDLIPGRVAPHAWRADRAGTYRGVCAEFCGYQHAHMALLVIAEAPDAYAAWAERQRQPAAEPADDAAKRGRDVFLTSTCAMCHAVDGTTAQAQRAPNLTHVASRRTIAAGTLANSPANRAAWIADPQAIKPGANMPPHALRPEDARALFAYVDTLQ